MKRLLFLCLMLSGCASGGFLLENDILNKFATNHDKFYTNGAKFSYYKESEDHKEKETYSLNQVIYTPSEKHSNADPEVLKNDRPYSGFLSGEYRDEYYTSDDVKNVLGIQLGCTGKCSLAKQVQQGFHKLIGQGIPSWDPKDSLSTEPGVVLEAERYYKAYGNEFSDLVGYGTLKGGNIIDTGALGAEYRIGYNLDHFEPEAITFKVPENPSNWKAYFFTKAEERYVLYNYMLQGSLFQNENHTVTPEPFMSELDFGIALGYKKFSILYRVTYFSQEWKTEKGGFSFGGISLDW